MKITVIGHLSLLFEYGSSALLMDPLLVPTFGHEYSPMPVELYPPRHTDASALQHVCAVLVTHEHFDHFNLESLNLLPRTAEILIGPLMLNGVARAITALGFHVRRLPFFEDYTVGELTIRLYPAAPDTAHWEKRVSQLRATDPMGASVLVGVDALFGEQAVEDALSDPPTALAIANNAHVPPRGMMGALTNYADRFAALPKADGVVLVKSLFAGIDEWPELVDLPVIFTGGGFRKDYDQLGIFALAEQDVVARLACALMGRTDIYGPLPGQTLILTPEQVQHGPDAPWVTIDIDRFDNIRAKRQAFMDGHGQIGRRHIMSPGETDLRRLPEVEAALALHARYLMLTPLGTDLLRRAYLGSAGLVMRFVDDAHAGAHLTYVFDMIDSAFHRDTRADELSQDDLVAIYPYGSVCSLCDFLALISGEIQIWDLAGVAVDTWFSGSRIEGPIPVMYGWWGEQSVPIDAEALFGRQVAALTGVAS